MNDNNLNFGKTIRARRHILDLTAKDLVKRLSSPVTLGYISRIEHGFVIPSEKLLIEICDILSISYEPMVEQIINIKKEILEEKIKKKYKKEMIC